MPLTLVAIMDLFLRDRHDLAFISGSPVIKLYVSFAPFLITVEQFVAGDAGRITECEFGYSPVSGIRLLTDLGLNRGRKNRF